MKKIILITAASALLLASGAWADDNSAMNCPEADLNPGKNMQDHGFIGKDKSGVFKNTAKFATSMGNTVGEMIQMHCDNPSEMHPRPAP